MSLLPSVDDMSNDDNMNDYNKSTYDVELSKDFIYLFILTFDWINFFKKFNSR